MRSKRNLALALTLAAPLAQGADETGKGYVAPPQIGWVWADNGRNVDDDRYYGLGVGKHLTPRWSLELNATKGEFDGLSGGELDVAAVSVDALRVFKRPSRVSPFISFGAGYIEDNPRPGPRMGDWLGQLGAGLLVDVAENDRGSFVFQLRPEIKARWDGNDMADGNHAVDYLAGLGFVFAFGPERERARPAPPPPVVRPEPEPAPQVEEPAPPEEPPAVELEPLVLRGVHFATESAQLAPAAHRVLNDIAEQLQEHPRVTVQVQGHTDSAGDERYNLQLSRRRAEAVRTYLIGRGVSPERMTARGYGETQPIADNRSAAGRAENRRVALVVVENPGGARIIIRER